MSTNLASISSHVFKRSIPFYSSIISTNPPQFRPIPIQTRPVPSIRANHDPTYVPGKSPPEVPTAPPSHNPGIPPEMPPRHNVPEFDPTEPSPELPGPPGSIPPKPEIPETPLEPEVFPPNGPEITPPEPGPPGPTPPPMMGSDGLAFY